MNRGLISKCRNQYFARMSKNENYPSTKSFGIQSLQCRHTSLLMHQFSPYLYVYRMSLGHVHTQSRVNEWTWVLLGHKGRLVEYGVSNSSVYMLVLMSCVQANSWLRSDKLPTHAISLDGCDVWHTYYAVLQSLLSSRSLRLQSPLRRTTSDGVLIHL